MPPRTSPLVLYVLIPLLSAYLLAAAALVVQWIVERLCSARGAADHASRGEIDRSANGSVRASTRALTEQKNRPAEAGRE